MKALILMMMMIVGCGREEKSDAAAHRPDWSDKKIVIVGDSITKDWPQDVLEPNWQSIGVYGLISRQTLDRFEVDVEDGHAEVVIIASGTNDIYHNVPIGNTITNINEMVIMAKEKNIIPMIATVLPVSQDRATERPIEKIEKLNDRIREYCQENDLRVVDYYPAMLSSEGFVKDGTTDDGLHPNEEGYKLMKPVLIDALRGF